MSIINVMSFGAVGDGVTDDTSAITAALSSVTDSCTVLFPAGKYLVSGSLTIPSLSNCGIKVKGEGKALTSIIRKSTYTSGDIFYSTSNSNPLKEWLTISDLSIINTGVPVTAGASIHLQNRICADLRNIYIADGYDGVFIDGNCFQIYQTNVITNQESTLYPERSGCLIANGHTAAIFMSNCSYLGGTPTSPNVLSFGLGVYGVDGFQATGCVFSSGNYGVFMEAGHGQSVDDLFFENCVMDSARTASIYMGGSAAPQGQVFTNIRFNNCHINPQAQNGLSINTIGAIVSGDVDFVTFNACNINLTGGHGICIFGSSCYGGGKRNIQITACDISGFNLNNGNCVGVFVDSGVSSVLIANNYIGNRTSGDHGQYAIALQGNNINCTVMGNNLYQNLTAPIYFGTSMPSYVNLRVSGNIGCTNYNA